MTVGEICNREVVFIERSTSVVQAAALMRDNHVGDLVVVEERAGRRVPVGILTDRDIVIEILAKGVDPDKVAVGDIMSYELVTARVDDNVLDTVKRMRAKGVRRLPVVDNDGALAGILTVDDLIEMLAEVADDLDHLISREQLRERERRD
jgi:CBS domain-containing protein